MKQILLLGLAIAIVGCSKEETKPESNKPPSQVQFASKDSKNISANTPATSVREYELKPINMSNAIKHNNQPIAAMGKTAVAVDKSTSYSNHNYSHHTSNHSTAYSETDTRQELSAAEIANRKALAAKLSTPYAGAQNGQLTKWQREASAAAENGQSLPPKPSSNANNTPKNVANCDSGGGCNGTGGERYNSNGIGGYTSTNGKSCQNIGGQMYCN